METLLPLGSAGRLPKRRQQTKQQKRGFDLRIRTLGLRAFLEEVVPTSFKVKLFKCFLDSAVSEQIARMVAMKCATENATI